MSKLFISLCLILACAATGQAQSSDETLKIEARFLYLRKHASTPSDPLLLTKEGPAKISISSRSPREYTRLPSDGKIIIGTAGPSEEEPIIPFATGQAPAGASKILVLLAPAKDGKYTMMILDERKFKGGSVCFINQCGQAVGVTLDKKKFVVKNKSTHIHQPTRQVKPRNTHISFHVGSTNKKGKIEMKLLAESIWNLSPRRGEICVFYRDRARNRANFRVFASFFK